MSDSPRPPVPGRPANCARGRDPSGEGRTGEKTCVDRKVHVWRRSRGSQAKSLKVQSRQGPKHVAKTHQGHGRHPRTTPKGWRWGGWENPRQARAEEGAVRPGRERGIAYRGDDTPKVQHAPGGAKDPERTAGKSWVQRGVDESRGENENARLGERPNKARRLRTGTRG